MILGLFFTEKTKQVFQQSTETRHFIDPFPGEPKLASCQLDPVPPLSKERSSILGVLPVQMSFLSPNQQCQSTAGVSWH